MDYSKSGIFALVLLTVSVWAQHAFPADKTTYRIGPEDVLQMTVWRYPELTTTAPVGPDGNISFPLAGQIVAAGKTRQELLQALTDKLSKTIKSPRVSLVVTEYNSQKVYVLGAVDRPGVHAIRGPMTLLEALSMAGGVERTANRGNCSIIRGSNKIIQINVEDLLSHGNHQLNVPLTPGDTVYIPDETDRQVYVLGQVKTPGLYTIVGNFNVMDAIASAGGTLDSASLSSIQLMRNYRGTNPEVTKVDIGAIYDGDSEVESLPLLQPKDIIYVPRHAVAKFNYVLDQITPTLVTIVLADDVSRIAGGRSRD